MVKILIVGVILLIVEAAIISEVYDLGYGAGYCEGVVDREKEKKDGKSDTV